MDGENFFSIGSVAHINVIKNIKNYLLKLKNQVSTFFCIPLTGKKLRGIRTTL